MDFEFRKPKKKIKMGFFRVEQDIWNILNDIAHDNRTSVSRVVRAFVVKGIEIYHNLTNNPQ